MLRKTAYNVLSVLDEIGSRIIETVDFSGYAIILFFQSVIYLKNVLEKRSEILKQMYAAGVKSFLVSSIVAVFTGMILTLQTGIELRVFSQEYRVATILIATLTREMSPFISAIVLIASVGAAIAAEVSTMKVSEEIDALEMMSISPVKFLVMPRLVALSVMFPVMAIYFTVLGSIGGGVVAFFQFDISWQKFYKFILEALKFKAVYVGLFKSFVFGVLVSIICCAKGLRARNGAIGVGHATRSSVIASFLLVLIVGYFITSIFYGK